MRKLDIGLVIIAIVGIIALLQTESSLKLKKGFEIPLDLKSISHSVKPLTIPHPSGHRDLVYVTNKRTINILNLRSMKYEKFFQKKSFTSFSPSENYVTFSLKEGEYGDIICMEYNPEYNHLYVFTSQWWFLTFELPSNEERNGEKGKISLQHLSIFCKTKIYSSKGKDLEILSGTIRFTNDLRIHKNDKGIILLGVESEHHHYNYYALNSFSREECELRWSHNLDDYHFMAKKKEGKEDEHEEINPIFETFNDEHYGEVNWRVFKNDVLRQFPHSFRHPFDFSLNIDFFKPRKPVSAAASNTDDISSDNNKIHYPNVIVVHHRKGIEVLHLYTGRTLTTFQPLNHDTLYMDFNDDEVVESAKVHLHPHKKKVCTVMIETGVPHALEQMKFDMDENDEGVISICQPTTAIQSFLSLDFMKKQEEIEKFYHLSPAMVEKRKEGRAFFADEVYHDVVYYMNNGMITSIRILESEELEMNWKISIPSHFQTKEDHEFFEVSTFAIRKQQDDYNGNGVDGSSGFLKNNIIVTGKESVTMIDNEGNIQDVLLLEEPPIAPLLFEDFSGDGKTDILMITEDRILGIATKTSFGGNNSLTFLFLAFVVVIGAMYLSTTVSINDPLYERKKS